MQRGRSSSCRQQMSFCNHSLSGRAHYLLFYGLFVLRDDAQGQEINNTGKNATTTTPT
jgi:hypothetical protein